ncbi:MAG: hypothetical protein QW292_14375 [Candidatus Parvarchaeota archaeon]
MTNVYMIMVKKKGKVVNKSKKKQSAWKPTLDRETSIVFVVLYDEIMKLKDRITKIEVELEKLTNKMEELVNQKKQ